jgi:hypothetical protein
MEYRKSPKLGSISDFKELTSAAKAKGIRIITDISSDIEAVKTPSKYIPFLLHSLDEDGEAVKVRSRGDPVGLVSLNYRMKGCFDLLLEDVESLINMGVGGVYLQQASFFPPLFSKDLIELERIGNIYIYIYIYIICTYYKNII